jgi:hypothetical protein
MEPTTKMQRRISRTAAVALALAALAATGAGWAVYRHLAPPLPGLVRIELGLEPPATRRSCATRSGRTSGSSSATAPLSPSCAGWPG